MAKVARSIQIFDHHASAEQDLAGYPLPGFNYPAVGPIAKVTAVFDMARSGAGLAWDCFNPGVPRPSLISVIEDRDLWRFAIDSTREITAALFSYGYDFDLWDALMEEQSLGDLLVEGEAIERKHHQDIAKLLPVVQREMSIGGIRMPVANLPLTLTSDAGHQMAASAEGIAACYWDTPEGRVFSLRSINGGPDCQAIAVRYGGGGHVHAAGFRVTLGWEGD
jgi:oligoribonuclease NrnB/cAMP/cGMP phosphodiesterase (DHH superfamily)